MYDSIYEVDQPINAQPRHPKGIGILLEIRISQTFPRSGVQRDVSKGEKDIIFWQ